MNQSSIEWTDHTWNPVSGCSKVSQGCKNCYAERMFPRVYSRELVNDLANRDYPEFGEKKGEVIGRRIRRFTDVRTHMDRLEQPLRMRKGRRIFVNSMSDLFHEDVPTEFIADVFGVMAAARQHTFQVLTKRPERMRALLADPGFREAVENCMALYSGERLTWPLRNLWLGVSVEDQPTADERIPLLLRTLAEMRFISAEPLLGPIDLDRTLTSPAPGGRISRWFALDLVIAGGESGPRARPSHPDWLRSLRDQCKAAGKAFFFKQWGEWVTYTKEADALGLPWKFLKIDGTLHDYDMPAVRYDASDASMIRVGKKAAGRTLDGREHSELPCITA